MVSFPRVASQDIHPRLFSYIFFFKEKNLKNKRPIWELLHILPCLDRVQAGSVGEACTVLLEASTGGMFFNHL